VARFALGIDIGGTNTKVALVSQSGEVEGIETFLTGRSDPAELVRKIEDAAERIRKDNSIGGAGIAVAGFLNPARDRLSYNPNLEWLVGFPLRDTIANSLRTDAALEVDSNASCLGEYRFGAGRGAGMVRSAHFLQRRELLLPPHTGHGKPIRRLVQRQQARVELA